MIRKRQSVGRHPGFIRMERLVNGVRQGKAVVYTADKANLKALAAGLANLMPK